MPLLELLLLLLESITIICHIYLGDIRNRLPAIADFKRIMADEKFAGISCLDFVASTGIPWFASDFAVRYPGKVMHYVDLKSDKVDLCSDYVLSPTNDQIKRRFPATCISDMVKFEPPYYLYNVKGHNCHS